MRTVRVFFLFLSVLQFIFFLKLVEYVRGEEIQTSKIDSQGATFTPISSEYYEQSRGMFIAPNIKRKKLWNDGKSTNSSQTNGSIINSEGVKAAEVPLSNGSQPIVQTKREQYEKEVARLCPACENNQCASASIGPIAAGFPIVPVIIAVITGVAWFILFLIAWIFHTRPNTKGQQSGGYDEGGYGSPQPEYGPATEKPSIFDHFLKPNDRSLQSYTLLHNVLDSIGKLSDLYNSY